MLQKKSSLALGVALPKAKATSRFEPLEDHHKREDTITLKD